MCCVLCCHMWQVLHGACDLFMLGASRKAPEDVLSAQIACKAHDVHADLLCAGMTQLGGLSA